MKGILHPYKYSEHVSNKNPTQTSDYLGFRYKILSQSYKNTTDHLLYNLA